MEAANPTKSDQSAVADTAAKTDADKAVEKKAADAKAEQPKKIELTQEELDKKLADAVAAKTKADADAAAEAKRVEKEEADRKKGEYKGLYETEQQKAAKLADENAALKLETRKLQISGMLRDHVASEAKDYLGSVVDILPHLKIAADTSDADAAKQIKSVVADFVKRNPRTAAGTTFDNITPKTQEREVSLSGSTKGFSNRFSNL